jgi:serine/threonine protein phosphatase PrpC
MGNLLGAPVTEKETHVGVTGSGAEYGVSSMQGWRVHMEDAHITETLIYAADVDEIGNFKIIDLPGHSLFAVFDGHGGMFAAAYAGRNFCRVLSRQKTFVDYAKLQSERPMKASPNGGADSTSQAAQALLHIALTDAFVELDKEIYCALQQQKVPDADKSYQQLRNEIKAENCRSTVEQDVNTNNVDDEVNSGTTACVVLLTPDLVVCANAGDSRAVLSRLGNEAVPLSFDHKPDDATEERRIRAAGGYVAGGRVEGDLAVSRGFGDFRFKNLVVVMAHPFSGLINSNGDQYSLPNMKPGDQKVSPIPDISMHQRDASLDEFVIVACDGIWDVQSNVEAVKTVGKLFLEGEGNLGLVCEEVCVVIFFLRTFLSNTQFIFRSSLKMYRSCSFVTSVLLWVAKTT